jgi:hypothetical protein
MWQRGGPVREAASLVQKESGMTTATHYRNGLGTSSLVLGIIGVALSWIPIVNYAAVVLGVLGVALGMIGLNQVRKSASNNPVVAAIGVVLSVLAIVLSVMAFNSLVERIQESEPPEFGPMPTMDVAPLLDCPDIDDPDYAEKIADC